jgi:hypothetical protein
MMRFNGLALLSVICVTLGWAATAHSADDAKGPITWAKDVAAIVQNRCLECHRPGEVAPMSLMNYEEARPWAKSIKKEVSERSMPPFPADPSSLPILGAMNLSQQEIDTIVAWVDQGAQFGNGKDLPPPKQFKTYAGGWRLGEPQLVLMPEQEFKVTADTTDLYQCFVIPFQLENEIWLKGVEFKPGNPKVAHHFILFEDIAGKAEALDAEDPAYGFECANMDKLGGARIIKMWAPGNVQPLAPKGVGNKLNAKKNLILQAHYYNSTGTDQFDRSSIALHVAPPDETIDKSLNQLLVIQPNLNIKAGDPESKHEGRSRAMKDMTVYSAGVHMHLRGKSMGQWAKLPDSDQEVTMLWVPRYDFMWQLSYDFIEPFKAPKGTEFIMRSVHDNSAANPHNPDPNSDVKWGLYSKDEMAFSGGAFTYDDEKLGIRPKPISEADMARLNKVIAKKTE